MQTMLALPVAKTPRRPGRPRVEWSPKQRDRHYECAGLFLGSNWPVKRIAACCTISRATVYLWVRLAFAHAENVEGLRRLAASTARGRRWLREFDQTA